MATMIIGAKTFEMYFPAETGKNIVTQEAMIDTFTSLIMPYMSDGLKYKTKIFMFEAKLFPYSRVSKSFNLRITS